jgi:putative spermidine/putrescine transport system substrate-binding protein
MIKTIKATFLGLLSLAMVTSAYADLTFVSWGGAYTASQQKGYINDWNGKVTVENYNGGLGEIKAQVEAGNVTWDVVDILPDQGITGCDEGLFEKIDNSAWKDDLVVPAVSDCVAPQIFWAYTAFYKKSAFPGKKPKNIKDFFNVKKFPGKRGIHTWANATIEMALVADGVKPKDVYKVMSTEKGIDRAFKKLDEIKDHVVFWSAGSKPLELVSSGEVVMSLAYNGRIGAAILQDGKDFEYIWDATVLEQEYLAIPKGTKNLAEAQKFVQHAASAQSLAGIAKYISYGPMRKSSIDIIKKGEPWFNTGINILPHMPTSPKVLKRAVVADPYWWADNGAEVSERFGAWKGN